MPYNLARREALWAIKALRDEPLPLFAAAASRAAEMVPECTEPKITLQPMKAGREVVEDYRQLGLSLRAQPRATTENKTLSIAFGGRTARTDSP
jgi:error-prone DNA polymerase